MKRSHKIVTAVALALGLGLAGGAYAHQGAMGEGTGQDMHGGMHHGMHSGSHHGAQGGMHGMQGGREEHGAGQQLMTAEEREAFREKMLGAKTPEERRQIAQANRAEMQKRAQEKGITLHEHQGRRGRMGGGPAAAPTAPAATEQVQ